MGLPILRAGYLTVAYKIQEAAGLLSNSDVERRLDAALRKTNDEYWCYIVAVFGDDKSGDVVYSCDGGLKRAAYTCSETGAAIDTAAAVEVLPMTTYALASDPAALAEAGARHSKADVKMLQTMHDHAVSLGAACATKESGKSASPSADGWTLVESADVPQEYRLRESSGPDPILKIISPGRGSTGYYTEELIRRDGPEVFTKGTLGFINHATLAEETARPEGDWNNLAYVTTGDATWNDAGKYLEAPVKLFANKEAEVRDKAPFTGASIRAHGYYAESATGRPNPKVTFSESKLAPDGKPGLLAKITAADSIDLVTKAGRGGKLLVESYAAQISEAGATANPDKGGATDMDAAELKKLNESIDATRAENKKLLERAIKGDAREYVLKTLKGLTLHEAGKELVVESIMEREIPVKDGALDEAKLKEAVDNEAKRVGAVIAAASGSGRVQGMGGAPVIQIDAKETERREAEAKRLNETAVSTFTRLMGGSKEAAEFAAKGRAS